MTLSLHSSEKTEVNPSTDSAMRHVACDQQKNAAGLSALFIKVILDLTSLLPLLFSSEAQFQNLYGF